MKNIYCYYCKTTIESNEIINYDEEKNPVHQKCISIYNIKTNNVNHPSHYGGKDNIYEAIKIIEHYKFGFCIGNAVKYILRAGKKDPEKYIEDLEKAKWYLERKINDLKQNKK